MWLRYTFNKLVRSFVVKLRDLGLPVSYKQLNNEEYLDALMKKIKEEALEVAESKTNDELIEEIADVYEVIDSILDVKNIKKDEILQAQKEKRERKGDFKERYFMYYFEISDKKYDIEDIEIYKKNPKYAPDEKFHHHIVDFIIPDSTREKIYVQKRTSCRTQFPNFWELPGGHIEFGENIPNCVARELKEELNLEVIKNHSIIYEGNYVNKDEKYAYTAFLIEVSDFSKFCLDTREADEFRWIGQDELDIFLENGGSEEDVTYLATQKYFDLIATGKLYQEL